MDSVFVLLYKCVLYLVYGNVCILVYEMICFLVNIMCGCFGGCFFCFIIEYEGCIIQSCLEDLIINEIEVICDIVLGFMGVIFDFGGLIVNMYMLCCKLLCVE